jgi:hypothetical protein
LHRETGLRFNQLAIAGAAPREQLTVMRWVISHHPAYDAFVIVTDPSWCWSNPDPPLVYPFPFWLYGSDLDYLANVLSAKALDRAVYRIGIALGLMQPADPVAYFDYTKAVQVVFTPEPEAPGNPADARQPTPQLPWIERLHAFLATLPSNVRVVVAMPPVYFTARPRCAKRRPTGSTHARPLWRDWPPAGPKPVSSTSVSTPNWHTTPPTSSIRRITATTSQITWKRRSSRCCDPAKQAPPRRPTPR